MGSYYKKLGTNLKKVRDTLGLSQEYFGLLTGYSSGSIHNFETGKNKLPAEMLGTLKWLGINIDIPTADLNDEAKKYIENIKHYKAV